ncbi:hypothetical protein HBI21_077380 [Parastagonospora nodorum]|nr:hypothetical protein HBI21_077380 [Parastagonospora nodorum]
MAMRVIVDGDSNKVYRKGEKVTGRISIVVEEEVNVQSLKVVFAGNCITKTSRPFHVNGNGDASLSRREFEEKIRLFNQEKEILPQCSLAAKKYHWAFEFTFPELTEPRYNRIAHGANYLKEPHPLPPSFQLKTNVQGGVAQISYFIQARLTFSKSTLVKRCRVLLLYQPTPQLDTPRHARCTSTVLYDQIWKSAKDVGGESQRTVSRVLSKVSRQKASARIIPSILYLETIAPGQHIPISVLLRNTRDGRSKERGECTIDSLSITISTYSTSMCGHSITEPEDVVSKHVTCIARTNMNKPAPLGKTISLTSNFRLVNNVECIPTFKTYTITRRYALNVVIGVKYGKQQFTVRSTTPLEIVPRVLRDRSPPPPEYDEDVEPLPLYVPREPEKECAPDYESIFALSRTSSAAGSSAPSYQRSESYGSDSSRAPSTAASTPASEIEEPVFERDDVMRTAVRA